MSFALNGRPGVGAATRRHIQATADKLGFRPSTGARALASRKAFAVGLVMARPARLLAADPFYPRFIAGIEAVLAPRGYALVLQVTGSSLDDETAGYLRMHAEGRIDGVFLTDLRRDDHRCSLVQRLGIPAVAVGLLDGVGSGICTVGVDDRIGVTSAVQHLASLGHERIGHVAGPGTYVHSLARRAAWQDAVRAAGLARGRVTTGDFTATGGAAATRRLLALPQRPTAIVYANDLMAAAGMAAAQSQGLDIPGDLSVVGFDDAPLSAHLHPPLTTVRLDVEAWGEAATTALLDLTSGGEPHAHTLDAPQLVVRSSTGPPQG